MRNAVVGLAILVMVFLAGCLPRTRVKQNPGPEDSGVRFYRPKPYLFLTPRLSASGTAIDGLVAIDIKMLPDFSEEYSIQIDSGFGVNDTAIKLTDGWNLTELNVDVDSKTADNVEAITDLLKAIPTLTGAAEDSSVVVRASNVPFGLYEAILSPDQQGRKQLYGFRYVGFLPYATCPTTMHGKACEPCHTDQIYGLVFEQGVMVFRPLHSAGVHLDTERTDTLPVPQPDSARLQRDRLRMAKHP